MTDLALFQSTPGRHVVRGEIMTVRCKRILMGKFYFYRVPWSKAATHRTCVGSSGVSGLARANSRTKHHHLSPDQTVVRQTLSCSCHRQSLLTSGDHYCTLGKKVIGTID